MFMRVCSLMGCGLPLLTKAGNPDFRKYFCSRECKKQDQREKKQFKRRHLATRKCPLCGRRPPVPGVSQDTILKSDDQAVLVPEPQGMP